MAIQNETFVLVRLANNNINAPAVVEIIRTYLSSSRAEQDRELLTDATGNTYAVMTINHVDD